MKKGLGALLLLSLSLGLAACDKEELAELQATQRKLDLELAELTEIATTLPTRNRERQELVSQLALHCAPGTAPELLSRVQQQIPEAKVSLGPERAPRTGLLVTAEGPATRAVSTVKALAEQSPFLSVEKVSSSSGTWTLVIHSDGPCPEQPVKAPGDAPTPLPPQGWFKTSETRQLREQIASTESRLRDLRKVLSAVMQLNALKERTKQAVEANGTRKDRIRQQLPVVELVFGGTDTVPSTLDLTKDESVYEGLLPLGDEPWTTRLGTAGYRALLSGADRWVLVRP